jgi:hypothetical protein
MTTFATLKLRIDINAAELERLGDDKSEKISEALDPIRGQCEHIAKLVIQDIGMEHELIVYCDWE